MSENWICPDFCHQTLFAHSTKNCFQAHFDPEELFRNIFGEFSRNYRSGGRGGFQDIFQDFSPFGFGSAAQETVVNLTFQQAAKGVVKEIEIIQVSGSAR